MKRVAALLIFAASSPAIAWSAHEAPSFSERYVLTGADPGELKANLQASGAKIIASLRYHSGFVVELTSAQARSMETLLSLRQSVRGIGISTRLEEPEIFERDKKVVAIDAMIPAIINEDPDILTRQQIPWGVRAIHAPDAFESTQGESSVVCVIDSGVQASHPDLQGAILGGENTATHSDDPEEINDFEDDNGHGTHVAGTIAARDNGFGVVGVAPKSKLFIVKALDHHGAGTFSSLAEGIRSCMAHGAQVINMSLAYTDDTEIIRHAVRDAIDAGIVLVAAAGNSKGAVEYPARFPGVIAVSSLDPQQRFSYFSSRGPEISFSAPGENILSTYVGSRYAVMQGTSQATPHVSGVAALLISSGVRNVAAHLRGVDLGLPREQEGMGRIDALKSLGLSYAE